MSHRGHQIFYLGKIQALLVLGSGLSCYCPGGGGSPEEPRILVVGSPEIRRPGLVGGTIMYTLTCT